MKFKVAGAIFGRLSPVVHQALGEEPHARAGQGEEGTWGGASLVLTGHRAQHGPGIP